MRIVIGVCKFHQMNDECMHFDKNDHHTLQRFTQKYNFDQLDEQRYFKEAGRSTKSPISDVPYSFRHDIFDHKLLYSIKKNLNISY